MKKLVLSILFVLGLVTNSYATGSAGFTISSADVKSTVKDLSTKLNVPAKPGKLSPLSKKDI